MLRGKKAYERGESSLRPTSGSSGQSVGGPDGTLYVVNVPRDNPHLAIYRVPARSAWRAVEQPQGMGASPGRPQYDKRGPKPAWPNEGAQLVDLLSHPNGWWPDGSRADRPSAGSSAITGAEEKLSARRLATRAARDVTPTDRPSTATITKRWTTRHGMEGVGGADCERCLNEAKPRSSSGLKKIDDKDWALRRKLQPAWRCRMPEDPVLATI